MLQAPRISTDTSVETCANDARHDGEGGHGAVDAAIHPIAQIARLRPLVEALRDLARVVAVLQMAGIHGLLSGCRAMWHGRGRGAMGAGSLPMGGSNAIFT